MAAAVPDEIPSGSPTRWDLAREGAATAEETLFAELDRVFAHPYDSVWWRSSLIGWCRAHPDLLNDYVLERNSGRAHHH